MNSNVDLTAGDHCTLPRTDPSTAPSFSKLTKMDWKNKPSTETPWSCCCKEFQTDGKFDRTVIPLAAPRTMAVIRETYAGEYIWPPSSLPCTWKHL